MTDIFFVMEAEFTVDLGDEQQTLSPGSFVLVPPGDHTFANRGSVPARFLNVNQPAGNEQYLKEAMQRMLAGQPWLPAEMAQVAAQYDFAREPG